MDIELEVTVLSVLVGETLKKAIEEAPITFDPRLVAATLFVQALEVLKEHHKESASDLKESVDANVSQMYSFLARNHMIELERGNGKQ